MGQLASVPSFWSPQRLEVIYLNTSRWLKPESSFNENIPRYVLVPAPWTAAKTLLGKDGEDHFQGKDVWPLVEKHFPQNIPREQAEQNLPEKRTNNRKGVWIWLNNVWSNYFNCWWIVHLKDTIIHIIHSPKASGERKQASGWPTF